MAAMYKQTSDRLRGKRYCLLIFDDQKHPWSSPLKLWPSAFLSTLGN